MIRLHCLKILFFYIIGISLWFLTLTTSSYASSSNRQKLFQTYQNIEKKLFKHPSSLPIYIESCDENSALEGAVYSIIPYSFSEIKGILINPANWCDISLLHLNIKACTFLDSKDIKKLTVYSGRKFYQPPEDAYILEYQFRVMHNQSNYFHIVLSSDSGPLDTSNYRIELEAIPIESNRTTFIRFFYTYKYGLITQSAMEAYFATLGRNKIGFSIIDKDDKCNPIYVHGTRGAIERNALRYYFAISAYLDSLKYPKKDRFEKRIHAWYALTDQYKSQLFELSQKDYVRYKKHELQNQIKLQKQIDDNIKSPYPEKNTALIF
jgi:hypothetical protein